MKLERMSDFFASRLNGYDEHMLLEIEGARGFYPYTASLLPMEQGAKVLDLVCGTGLELEYYFAESEEAEHFYFSELKRLKSEQGLEPDAFYHYDTPLTVEHEMEILQKAGFSDVRIMQNWKSTYTILARL